MRKRWLVLFLPVLSGIPLALAASAVGGGAPPDAPPAKGAPDGVAAGGPPEVLPPCDGVLKVQLRPIEKGRDVSEIEWAVCEKGPPGAAADAAGTQTAHARAPVPAKGRSAKRGARGVYREAAAGALIGQDFNSTSYRTLLVQWTGSSYGCTSGQAYAVPNVGTSLNDRFESSKSFSGCARNYHYQNSSYTGSLQPCGTTCGTLGSLNNQTTSERWSR